MGMSAQPDLATLAAQYHGYGANVLAIRPESKKPAHVWKRYQTARQLISDVGALPWGRAARIGLVNGVSGIRSFDLDECEQGAAGLLPVWRLLEHLRLPDTYEWIEQSASGRGYHLWVTCNDDMPAGALTAKDDDPGVFWGESNDDSFEHLELRWERNQTIIASSDGIDRWLNGAPSAAPTVVEIEHILAAFRAVTVAPTLVSTSTVVAPPRLNNDHAQRDRIRDAFDMVAYAKQSFGSETHQDSNHEVRILGNSGLLINVEKGVWYRFGGEVGGDCFDLIGEVKYGSAWNRNNNAMFVDALREASSVTGVLLEAERVKRPRLVTDDGEIVDDTESGIVSRRVDLWTIIRDGVPQPEMLVPPFLVDGRVTCIAGGPEQGKSWLLAWSLLSVARTGRNVLYLDEESGMADAASRFQALSGSEEELGRIIYLPFVAGDYSLDDLAIELMQAAIKDEIALFGVDSFSKLFAASGLDENSNTDATTLMRAWITPVSHQLGRSVLLLDHKTKVDETGRYGRGASAKLADTDVQWNVEATVPFSRIAKGRVSLERQKDRTSVLPTSISLILGGDGAGGFTVETGYVSESPAVRVNRADRKFLEALYDHDNTPKSWGEWAEAVGGSRDTFNSARRRLIERESVLEAGDRYWVTQGAVEAYGLGVNNTNHSVNHTYPEVSVTWCDTPLRGHTTSHSGSHSENDISPNEEDAEEEHDDKHPF